jgi:SRSO17 transposase
VVSRGLKKRRLELILKEVKGEEIMVIIDETGDRKKGIKQIMYRDNT